MTEPVGHSWWLAFGRRRVLIAGTLAATVIVGVFIATVVGALAASAATRIGVGAVGVVGVWLTSATLRDMTVPPPGTHGALPRALPSRRRSRARVIATWLGRRVRPGRPEIRHTPWAELEATVRLAETSAADFHIRLRRRLAVTIGRRLRIAGIDPNDRDRVVGALGELAAQIVDPASDVLEDRHAPGVPATELRELLRKVEALS